MLRHMHAMNANMGGGVYANWELRGSATGTLEIIKIMESATLQVPVQYSAVIIQ